MHATYGKRLVYYGIRFSAIFGGYKYRVYASDSVKWYCVI